MNNCSPWIHEIYQGIFEICTDLGILVVNAKYAQKYTVAYTRFFAQCGLFSRLVVRPCSTPNSITEVSTNFVLC